MILSLQGPSNKNPFLGLWVCGMTLHNTMGSAVLHSLTFAHSRSHSRSRSLSHTHTHTHTHTPINSFWTNNVASSYTFGSSETLWRSCLKLLDLFIFLGIISYRGMHTFRCCSLEQHNDAAFVFFLYLYDCEHEEPWSMGGACVYGFVYGDSYIDIHKYLAVVW